MIRIIESANPAYVKFRKMSKSDKYEYQNAKDFPNGQSALIADVDDTQIVLSYNDYYDHSIIEVFTSDGTAYMSFIDDIDEGIDLADNIYGLIKEDQFDEFAEDLGFEYE